MGLTDGQREAVEQLRDIERAAGGAIELRCVAADVQENGYHRLELSIVCRHLPRAAGGLPLRDREHFIVLVPPDFPFVAPALLAPHTRFAGFEHVQWSHSLCLYQSPETEWDSSDGMFGFIHRVVEWLTLGALNQFEPTGAPLHPPVAYADVSAGLVVSRADTPRVQGEPWFGLAVLKRVHERRVDIVGWRAFDGEQSGSDDEALIGAALLLEVPFPFEYPRKVAELIAQLAERGLSRRLLLLTLIIAAKRNLDGSPLYVVLGTPMRGVSGATERRQHLAVWRLDSAVADALRIMAHQFSESERLREIGTKMEEALVASADSAKLAWAYVREARREVTVRRDHGTPLSFFAGRTVAVWGCGALGGHVAEMLARVGVKTLVLRDRGDVAPGLLARQPFDDGDIGLAKATSIAERVRRIDPQIEIVQRETDLLRDPLGTEDWTDGADVVIDASASAPVLEKLEFRRARSTITPVPILSMAVDHRAERGLVAVVGAQYSGGPADAARRAKLDACRRAELASFAEAFWPGQRRHPVFQPEPGCSASTFIGSAADLMGLAASMLNLAARDLTAGSDRSAAAHLITQPHVDVPQATARQASLVWSADVISVDPETGYEVRIAHGAWMEIQGWIERAGRTLGAEVETGGVLFGERNDAARVIWVSEVIGPPPDSASAPEGFICGVAGVAQANAEKCKRTRGSVAFVGMWHTHPSSIPVPSETDLLGMARIVAAADARTPKALLVIVGRTTSAAPALGTFLFTRDEFELRRRWQVYTRECALRRAPTANPKRNVGLALSGGGSRAIAFHLGCLRALHDRGVIDQVSVLSTVSGGSVIGALYAYGDGDFAAFEQRVEHLLRRGLVRALARRVLLSSHLLSSMATAATAGMVAVAADVARVGVRIFAGITGMRRPAAPHWTDGIEPPLRRWRSRTTAFEATLRDELFGDLRLSDRRRGGLEVVFNATELRTGTAFRFGSGGSGCARFGAAADTDTSVALAVAASAAYPALLPALDLVVRFTRPDRAEISERVLLTDGGVYDNLGTMCLEPGRSDAVSQHVFRPDYIIACDAGVGVVGGTSYPSWWPTRMSASFETVFRRAQNSTRDRLHRHVASGALKGFVFPYLGQQDRNLSWAPSDLVPRASVATYPTDFSPMSADNIHLLARRGEQLTRLLVAHYCPEL